MTKRWVVVADQSKARIFTTKEPRGPLQELVSLDNPYGREQEQSLVSDRPGRSFDSHGQGRHSMGTTVDPSETETIRFARRIADHLQEACNDGRCKKLLLVAGPYMLGVLRKQLNTPESIKVSAIDKNLGQYDAREIRTHLPELL
ncbi:MAG: host attachment protein [Gammaproteobacteria bacterium]